MALGQYNETKSLLLPFSNQPEPPSFELFFILGKSYQSSGEFDMAIATYDKALTHYGLNTNLLNSLGECYFQMGIPDEALAAWEKSLELNPEQPEIQKNVKVLKEKK